MNTIKNREKSFMTLSEVLEEKKNRPKSKFLWNGIKENSIGLIFGPSKSGKTIFCENLGMKIAMGANDYFGCSLDGIPKRVLFVGLEEFWENRAERNKHQLDVLDEKEKQLVSENFLVQPLDFISRINGEKDWGKLEEMIVDSKAEVVFIDSITRMNSGKLENSADSEKLMQKLRDICYRTKVTLICVHHTPKMGDKIIDIDSIKGSSTFAQESDFAIAVTKAFSGKRYVKEIFFRYAPVNEDFVKEFEITSSVWLDYLGDISEYGEVVKKDRRLNDASRKSIIQYLDSSSCKTFKTSELISHFTATLSIKERQLKAYLKSLTDSNQIKNQKKGFYSSINCVNDEE
ncbi:AAA family ATPase [uncultured Polaribacter sp.]|uniref:AAA family ATPase n=1 Tax=uncultured Polaribacter sp. TaxID=174711 RepID=UPI00260F698B|nr:AAA family ATPase [uncultured Polaribacter sp.]